MKTYKKILNEILSGKRLKKNEALILYRESSLSEIGQTACEFKNRFNHGDMATFIVDRNINYTNVCKSKCSFCAFYREINAPDAYVLSENDILKKTEEAKLQGATQIMLQGGLHPDLPFDYYLNIVKKIKSKFTDISVHSFSPPEITHFSNISNLSIPEVLTKLKDAGLDSLPGGGAEILANHIRAKISPKKITADQWLNVMELAHNSGLKTTATMMMGSIENFSDRLTHLEYIRNLQDKTKGFRAFIPWIFQPGFTELGGEKTSGYDYLKTLAISRLFLDNIANLQGSWVTCGKETGQMALWFGANDLGSIMMEENVVKSTGVSYNMTKDEMIELIREANKIPAERDTKYNIIKYPNSFAQ